MSKFGGMSGFCLGLSLVGFGAGCAGGGTDSDTDTEVADTEVPVPDSESDCNDGDDNDEDGDVDCDDADCAEEDECIVLTPALLWVGGSFAYDADADAPMAVGVDQDADGEADDRDGDGSVTDADMIWPNLYFYVVDSRYFDLDGDGNTDGDAPHDGYLCVITADYDPAGEALTSEVLDFDDDYMSAIGAADASLTHLVVSMPTLVRTQNDYDCGPDYVEIDPAWGSADDILAYGWGLGVGEVHPDLVDATDDTNGAQDCVDSPGSCVGGGVQSGILGELGITGDYTAPNYGIGFMVDENQNLVLDGDGNLSPLAAEDVATVSGVPSTGYYYSGAWYGIAVP